MSETADREGVRVSVERRSGEVFGPLDVVRAAEGAVPYVMHRLPDGAVVGLGEAFASTAPPGEGLRGAFDRLRERLGETVGSEKEAEALQIFFQVAFDPETEATGDLWSEFDRLKVIAPRVSLTWRDGELTIVRVGGGEACAEVEEVLDRAADGVAKEPRKRELRVERPGMEAYRSGLRRVIEGEEADKVVLARRAAVVSDRPFTPSVVLESLAEQYHSARLFALSPTAGGPVFLGASPERLIRVAEGRAETMALAGTAERSEGEEAAFVSRRLMQSAKDRDEHGYVTRMIAETLGGLGADVEVAETPRPMILPNVVHLETPISATLPDGVGVVDLVDALHPTPAVCGTPTEVARGMIRQLEPFDRGLYAGAVGWTNLAGEGDVTVALRCGLLRDRWAHLFAGGGITADSEVDEEVAETESKFMPVLEALREAVA